MAITDLARPAAGKLGKAIDTVGNFLTPNSSGTSYRGIDVSSTLQNWGGNVAGSLKDAIVKPAYAAPSPSASMIDWNQYQYTPYKPAPTTQINKTSSGGSSGQYNQQGNPFDDMANNIDNPGQPMSGGPSHLDVINNEFNSFNSLLDQQEGLARSRFDETKGLYDTMRDTAKGQYETEKSQQTEDIKKTENLNLAKVRQLLGELSQRDAARTAITGGGSTSEALAERFGREAQSRMGNVMDQSQQAIQRVNTFYDNAITNLNNSYQQQIMTAKQALEDNISAIQSARQQSASAKQRNTLEAWRDYYDRVNTAKLEAANFKAQYDMWKSQQDQALAATQDFSLGNADQYNQGLGSSYSIMPQSDVMQTQQQAYNPYFRIKKGEEDEFAQQQGLNYTPANWQAYQ